MSNKKTSWILELQDQITGPLRDINREAKIATSIGEDLGETFEDVATDLNETGDAADVAADDFLGMIGNFNGADFGIAQQGLDAISGGIKNITRAGLAFIATPIGAAIAVLGSFGLVANEVVKYNEAAREANILTQQITQTTGDSLDATRIRAASLAKTFDKDLKDTLTVSKNLVEAFDVSFNEAFDSIQDGFIRGGQANDDYLQSLREYPKLFAQNGFALQDFQRIINEGIERGIYDDKLPDAIKEFSLSINEQTETSRAALERAFGKKFTEQLFKNIEDGSKTPKEALQAIAAETERVGVNAVDAQVLTADLFRGAGEDAGGFLEVIDAVNEALNEEARALTPLEEHLDIVARKNLELAQAQDYALNSEKYQEFSEQMTLVWKDIQIFFYDLISAITYEADQFAINTAKIFGVIEAYPTVVKNSFTNVMEDLGLLADTFLSFGDVVEKVMKFDFSGASESFDNFKKDLKDDISNLGEDLFVNPFNELEEAYNKTGRDIILHRQVLKEARNQKDESTLNGSTLDENSNTPVISNTGGKRNTDGRQGSGGGSGGNTINMTLNFNQQFTAADGNDIEDIATQVIRIFTDRFRDAVITTGV